MSTTFKSQVTQTTAWHGDSTVFHSLENGAVSRLPAFLVTDLEIRYCRLADTGRETLRKREAAEQQGRVNRVAGERVPEEGNASEVAHCETCATAWVAVQKSPDPEVGDQEKLQSSQERRSPDTEDIAFMA